MEAANKNNLKKGKEIMETKTLNIYEKLSLISTELSTVAKNLEVGVGQAKYKAVGEADVLRAVKPLEAKYRVYSYPVHRSIIESGEVETKNGVKQLFERMEVVYRFINIDNPSEYIDITTYGDGIDAGDKSVGKAMTYADKYALLKAYKIVTGEDPDQNPSEDLKGAKTQKTTKAPFPTQVAAAPALKPAPKQALDRLLLNECQRLDIKLEDVAAYLKKKVEELTNEDLKRCIDMKLAALGGKK